MASLKDISAALGVSVSLVSKVLSGRLGTTGVRPELMMEIRRRAAAMGYRKNASADSLRRGRHDVIGVFIHRAGQPGSGLMETMLEGISSRAIESHQKQFLNFFETKEAFQALSEIAHDGFMDGLIVGGIIHADILDTMLAIRATGIPLVTVFDEQVDVALPNVGIDQVKVSRVAADHLIECGCRRIAHIHNREDRAAGYRAALEANGIIPDPRWVYTAMPSDFGHSVGEKAVQTLLGQGVEFDGLVAQSDEEAVGAINALFRAGRKVPDDVRVVGIDDAPYCEFAQVPLTSVSQNLQLRGRKAVELLLAAIDGQKIKSVLFEPILKPRESSRQG